MAHERGQADTEAGRSMRFWGWPTRKKQDALRCPNCKRIITPAGKPGTWDFPATQVVVWELRQLIEIAVEVKATTTALPFSDLRSNQREWAESKPELPKWLWICLGKTIRDGRYPRKTWFLPLEVFLEQEQHYLSNGRKSLPYDCPALDKWALKWLGNKLWDVPFEHPLRTEYKYL